MIPAIWCMVYSFGYYFNAEGLLEKIIYFTMACIMFVIAFYRYEVLKRRVEDLEENKSEEFKK